MGYWQREIHHAGLNKYRVIRGDNKRDVDQQADAILAQWEQQWAKIKEREAKNHAREARLQNIESSIAYANEQTKEAEQIQEAMDRILINSLNPQWVKFDSLKDYEEFSEPKPPKPKRTEVPKKPLREDAKYNPKVSFFTKLSAKKMQEICRKNDELYGQDLTEWQDCVEKINKENNRREEQHKELEKEWEQRKNEYYAAQEESNSAVDEFSESFSNGEPMAIERYIALLIERIEYPFSYEQGIEAEYSAEEKKIIVDLQLPVIDDIPKRKAVTYVKSKDEIKETFHTEAYLKKKYDQVIYQIILQVLNYVFSTIVSERLQTVVINGKIKTIDKATGKIYLNEINTIPGSLSFYLWEPIGVKYTELLDRMIQLALKRNRENARLMFSFETNVLAGVKLGGGTKGAKGSKL